MRKILVIILIIVAVLGYSIINVQTHTMQTSIQDLTLQNTQINTDTLNTPYIVNFFASWCPPCEAEMPLLQDIHNANNITVIGINLGEDTKAVQTFTDRLNITFPIILDPDADYKKQFNVITQPATFFIYTNGTIAYSKLGPITAEELTYRTTLLE